jgi:small-conductance mechanosensitive channel
MPPENKEKATLDSKSVEPKDNPEEIEPLNPAGLENSSLSEIAEDLVATKDTGHLKQAYFFRNLLLAASIILVAGTVIFNLDLLPAVMLGCGVIGFNYFWTMQFVRKLLQEQKLQALDLLFSFTKFGISVIILFVAMQYFDFSPLGLLIGLSNIALAVIIYSFIRVMRPQ